MVQRRRRVTPRSSAKSRTLRRNRGHGITPVTICPHLRKVIAGDAHAPGPERRDARRPGPCGAARREDRSAASPRPSEASATAMLLSPKVTCSRAVNAAPRSDTGFRSSRRSIAKTPPQRRTNTLRRPRENTPRPSAAPNHLVARESGRILARRFRVGLSSNGQEPVTA